MDEFSTLRTLRSEVPLPSNDQLAPALAQLERAMAAANATETDSSRVGSAPRKSRQKSLRHRLAWTAGSLVGAVALVFGAGHAAIAFNSQQTNERLREVAGAAVEFDDLTPGPGQYLLASSRWDIRACESPTGDGTVTAACEQHIQRVDVYMPSDPAAEWVMVSDADSPLASGAGVAERFAAPHGDFLGPAMQDPDRPEPPGITIPKIPDESGEAALKWIDEQYYGGSASRDEDNFFRIQSLLASGLVPAKQRAALIEALALIPGVTSTQNVPNLDGLEGTAFGRTESKRDGERTEIIIDPETGLVIGMRSLAGKGVAGANPGDVTISLAITTRVVDAAPSGATFAAEAPVDTPQEAPQQAPQQAPPSDSDSSAP